MKTIDLEADTGSIQILYPKMAAYLGLWACDPAYVRTMTTFLAGVDLAEHVRLNAAAARRSGSAVAPQNRSGDSVQIIFLTGSLTKYGSSLDGGASTIQARSQVRSAARDPRVESILLVVDSPGGSVAGADDLAREIAAAAAIKPVVAFIEDLGASAAYWVASQAGKIIANPSGLVGSIGTYAILEDSSALAKKEGIRVVTVSTGEFKGMGAPGTEITQAQIDHFQSIVNASNDHFLRAVSAGRKMPMQKLASIADGRVFPAKEALALGLIDAIGSFDDAFGSALGMGAAMRPAALAAATLAELKAELIGADPAFLCTMQEKQATLADAKKQWIVEQGQRLAASGEYQKKQLSHSRNSGRLW